MNNSEQIYKTILDRDYILSNTNDKSKNLYVDNEKFSLVVGIHFNCEGKAKINLILEALFKDKTIAINKSIPVLKSYSNEIAICDDAKNKKVITKLKELNIISDSIRTISYKNKKYEIVEVNLNELKLYEPLGKNIINDFMQFKANNKNVEKELEKYGG